MLSLRSVRALEASAAGRAKATAAAAARPRPDEEDHGLGDHRQAELLQQLQEREIRIPVPWGHVAGAWWGRTDRRPLLALHGWGDNAGSFARLASSLRGVPVLALDLPGHGLSSRPPRGVAPADRGLLLGALRRVQRALGLTALSLVGHSLGDAIALQYAAAYPADVDLYVSLDPLVPSPTNADAELKSLGGQVDELLEAEEALDAEPRAATRAQLLATLLAARGGSLNRHAAECGLLKQALIFVRLPALTDAAPARRPGGPARPGAHPGPPGVALLLRAALGALAGVRAQRALPDAGRAAALAGPAGALGRRGAARPLPGRAAHGGQVGDGGGRGGHAPRAPQQPGGRGSLPARVPQRAPGRPSGDAVRRRLLRLIVRSSAPPRSPRWTLRWALDVLLLYLVKRLLIYLVFDVIGGVDPELLVEVWLEFDPMASEERLRSFFVLPGKKALLEALKVLWRAP